MPTDRRLVGTSDGTRVFAELHGRGLKGTVVVCLPGLTRNGRDFEPVVDHLADKRPVLTIDFRGRGRSDHAADPLTYRPDVEMADTLAVLADFDLQRIALLGTSRGGIVGMLMAAHRPDVLAGLFLNDIGPRVEPQSLLRIREYVGLDVSFPDWESAARHFAAASPGFAGVNSEQWLAAARRVYAVRENGRIGTSYDLNLSATLPAPEDILAGKTAELWAILPSLADKPVSCLRGAGSDLLSPETLQRLKRELPQADTVTVPGRGHVPFLDEPESLAAIDRWLARVDAKEKDR
ncbi:MAG: alpha/beta hydrolase [Phyllobacteriaceae bacterium]|nr:alpha/beta hydrolase [Phyllobacteriaceae bacterium]